MLVTGAEAAASKDAMSNILMEFQFMFIPGPLSQYSVVCRWKRVLSLWVLPRWLA